MTSYTDSLLASGERVLRREHQHWLVLLWRSRYAIGALILAAVLLVVGGSLSADGAAGALRGLLGIVTPVAFVAGLAWIAWSVLRYRTEEYVITSRRIIHSEGVVNKRATDSSLEKINDAILTESMLGRMFGFGDLDVLTASELGIERLRMLRGAKEFKKAMLNAKHELEMEFTRPVSPAVRADGTNGDQSRVPVAAPLGAPISAPVGAPVAAPPRERAAMTPDEVTTSLERLGDLRARGVLTTEEFESKKRELLARL